MEEIKHYQVNGRYRVMFERSAVKGVDGFKVEANGDDLEATHTDAECLYLKATQSTRIATPAEVKV